MKNDFICMTQNAVKEIVQAKNLQSQDFNASSFVINVADGELSEFGISEIPLYGVCRYKGVYIFHRDDKYLTERNSVTFDFSMLSFGDVTSSMKITAVQKTLRFCIRYWENLSYSSSEVIPLDSTKGIVFPFSTGEGMSNKVVLELSPFKGKSNKERKFQGKHLLVYKFGQSAGAKNKEECNVGTLTKALDGLFSVDIFKYFSSDKASSSRSDFRGAVDLGNDLLNTTFLLGRENPFEALSDKQKFFIESDWRLPARLHGPAGSGKTICLVLKSLMSIANSESGQKVLFIVPGVSVRNTVEYFLKVTAESCSAFKGVDVQQIKVRTIQQVCMDLLSGEVNDTELLDEDGYEAKQTQLLIIMELVEKVKENLVGHKKLISEEMYTLFLEEDSLALAELLSHEFGVAIKGRCGENKEEYVSSNIGKYGLPSATENDKYFIFGIFDDYQNELISLSQFDPDDIALSVIGKLESPLWKRRRRKEGYDFIVADELHLLNFNELSLIHFLSKDPMQAPISFAVDATQAVGDIAWKNESVLDYLNVGEFSSEEKNTDLTAVFRCSGNVTRLASTVTSSGTSLFTNFIDPLAASVEVQSEIDEYEITYNLFDESSASLHLKALSLADDAQKTLGCLKHKVIIIYFDRLLFDAAKSELESLNKPVSCLLERGDIKLVQKARAQNNYVIAMADYVGGLEFDAVILVGVDKGRLPREDRSFSGASKAFQSYTAHNRLYVAITRASKIVKIVGDVRRGVSPVLENALTQRVLCLIDETALQA